MEFLQARLAACTPCVELGIAIQSVPCGPHEAAKADLSGKYMAQRANHMLFQGESHKVHDPAHAVMPSLQLKCANC